MNLPSTTSDVKLINAVPCIQQILSYNVWGGYYKFRSNLTAGNTEGMSVVLGYESLKCPGISLLTFFLPFLPQVLFGKVKKIQPSLDKSKVSLDPSPNFDCHMSRNTPSLKDTIELQAYSSAVC